MFPLSLFLIKIKFKKPTETEKDLFIPPLICLITNNLFILLSSSGLMAQGNERGTWGPAHTPSFWAPWLSCTSQTQGEQHLSGAVLSLPMGDKGAVLRPKTCFGLGSTFPCTFPPSTILSVHPLGTVLVLEGLCPLLPNAAGMLRNAQETSHIPNSLGEAEEAQGTYL